MPRKPRENVEDGIYHVYSRGTARRFIYLNDTDRRTYLRLLAHVVETRDWRCLAFCIMGNHNHLLIETPRANLSEGMQYLQGRYAQGFNSRYGEVGHLFQGRYGAKRIISDGQLWSAAAYIARNPIEAGLCRRPEDWPWSSFRFVYGGGRPSWLAAERLLSFFGATPEMGRRSYIDLTLDS